MFRSKKVITTVVIYLSWGYFFDPVATYGHYNSINKVILIKVIFENSLKKGKES